MPCARHCAGSVPMWACLQFIDQEPSFMKLSTMTYCVGARTKIGMIPKPVFFLMADKIYVDEEVGLEDEVVGETENRCWEDGRARWVLQWRGTWEWKFLGEGYGKERLVSKNKPKQRSVPLGYGSSSLKEAPWVVGLGPGGLDSLCI